MTRTRLLRSIHSSARFDRLDEGHNVLAHSIENEVGFGRANCLAVDDAVGKEVAHRVIERALDHAE